MKKYLCLIILMIVINNIGRAQNPTYHVSSVEKSQYGFQTSLLGLWGYYEKSIGPEFVLRGELGFVPGLFIGVYEETVFTFSPTLTLEPRWYYNLEKRQSKNKRTDNNSGNFIAIGTSYQPGWFVISNEDLKPQEGFHVTTKWGIRRNLGAHFNFETGAGIGYAFYNTDPSGDENSGFFPNIYLRIGYIF